MKRVGIMQEYISQTKRDLKADAVSANYQRLRAQLQRDTAQAWLDLALSQRAVDSAVRLAVESEQQISVRRLIGVAQVQPTGVLPRFERLPADVAVLTQDISQHPEILQARRKADVAQARQRL